MEDKGVVRGVDVDASKKFFFVFFSYSITFKQEMSAGAVFAIFLLKLLQNH
jgi:hypothetical protein